jgi:hypothetical protein
MQDRSVQLDLDITETINDIDGLLCAHDMIGRQEEKDEPSVDFSIDLSS